MCWGLDCGDGWFDLIDTLCANIQRHVDWLVAEQKRRFTYDDSFTEDDMKPEEDLQVVAAQVKEKFGGLRFYFEGGDDEVSGMVQMAESMSYHVCEDCGNKGILRKGGWYRTMCDPCNDTWQARRAQNWDLGMKDIK